MAQVILDIETTGKDFESLDKISQEYLLKYADSEEEKSEIKERLGLYPLTGGIVAVGLLNPESQEGRVYFQAADSQIKSVKKDRAELIPLKSEREILVKFWETVRQYTRIITFNGRAFDCPFLITRSAANKVKASKNLMPNRYNPKEHLDLFDQLSFFGSVRKNSVCICGARPWG